MNSLDLPVKQDAGMVGGNRNIICQLPEDLVLHIALYSDIADVFALKQTCRNLYMLTDSDYLWHQVLPREELTLDISPYKDPRELSAHELRASAIRALKLQANWSRKRPRVCGFYVANARTFDELMLLHGGTILLGIHRDRHSQKPSMSICTYSLQDARFPRLIAQFSIPTAMKDFDACIEGPGDALVLAATVTKDDTEVLEVYYVRLPLDTPAVCNGTYEAVCSFALRQEGLFHKVSLHGEYIVSSIMNHSLEHGGQSSHVLLANWKTRLQITINPRFADNLDQMDVRICPPFLAVVGASVSKVQITLVPLEAIALGGVLEQPIVSRAKQGALPQFPRIVVPLMDFYDICISNNNSFGSHVTATSLSLIVFPTLSRLDVRQSKKALYLRFIIDPKAKPGSTESFECGDGHDLDDSSIRLDVSAPFDIPIGSYPEHPYLGTKGRRAVWIEQSLKSDYVQILRLDYNPEERKPPAVDVLLPPEPQLPFKPSSCRALAFDEASGRLCVGLYNGSVYILDYV
ncbi:hypothetical protein M0805_002368 [Coniferiporia weirii]|nr:hypothetical protein M0805_002368 [Coniferiporia weirii]